MPSGQEHLRFDRILRENGIIEIGDRECDEVHDRMDRDMYRYGDHGFIKTETHIIQRTESETGLGVEETLSGIACFTARGVTETATL
jgi:hypothetical protein